MRDMKDPFEQLERNHRRLEERLAELGRAAADASGPNRKEALAAMEDVLAFFDRSVRRHEADEEASLFPRLKEHAELAQTISELAREHQQQAALYAALDEGYQDPATAVELAARLDAAYRAHILTEERVLFPAARKLLDPETLSTIASEMQARRGR